MPEKGVVWLKVRSLTLCALFAALMAVCAWISVPVMDIAFTLQTLGLFLCLGLLGGRLGCVSVLVYLGLGMVGLPVFSGFQGGFGVLLGPTGGFLLGFPVAALCYWGITALLPKAKLPAMIASQLICYCVGCIWFRAVYLSGGLSLAAVIAKCVLPYLLPDALKIAAAWWLTRRLGRINTPSRA